MQYFYLVAPIGVIRAQDYAFTYHGLEPLQAGTIVRVPIGKTIRNGIVVAKVAQRPSFATKQIASVLVRQPLPLQLVELALWMSTYYATHLGVVLQTLLPAGLHRNRRMGLPKVASAQRERTTFVLSDEQQAAISTITEHPSTTFLLHGATGSGKTRVYIELAKRQAERGRSTIILVPEIALTPQLVAEFSQHFENLILTHSGLTESQRHKAWLKALEAQTPYVVIGPRSALFMPLAQVGLIVVDECHEPSYKQEQSPRYSALRAATMLAQQHKAKAVFGSATPSITDYYLATATRSPVVQLTKPATKAQTPTITIVDAGKRSPFRAHRFLADALLERIEYGLQHGQQTLLFHNRRGSAPTTLCEHCGWMATCPHCTLPLTLHTDKHQLQCHLCGYYQHVPPSCPVCHGATIIFKGIGTKLIETEISKLFPKARVARFDADTAIEQAVHNRYQDLYDGTIDIIIGTQMLAKGFDLPHLTTVGIVQADSGLLIPDYQAHERVFQLISQVIGRVGRQQLPGHIIIQTYQPENHILQAAIHKDYAGFYAHELLIRQQGGFPPFCYLLKLTCTYKTERAAIAASQKLAAELRKKYDGIEVLGPAPAFYERLGGAYRWQLIVKSMKRAQLVTIAQGVGAPWQFDLDAASLL